IPASTNELALRMVVEDAIVAVGSVVDRSGQPGIDQALADQFFAEVDIRSAWLAKGRNAALVPLGPKTAAAYAAWVDAAPKIEDYFTRCRIAAFDPRAGATLAGEEQELVALAKRTLSASDEDLGKLPLARIEPTIRLPLDAALNPAWAPRIWAFVA